MGLTEISEKLLLLDSFMATDSAFLCLYLSVIHSLIKSKLNLI